jgi:hypothetical protein
MKLAEGSFAHACLRLFRNPRIADLFPEYLIQTHCIIRTTVPLMEAASGEARRRAATDPVAAGVATYLTRHAEEERDHDEWLLEDLAVLGTDRSEVLARVPSPTVASLVGSQYYWALHYHPVSLLGYFAFMEGYPPAPSLIDELVLRTGFPPEAFRTMAKHGELDGDHRKELDEAIDGLPLSREQDVLLGLSVLSGLPLLARSIEEVLETARAPADVTV